MKNSIICTTDEVRALLDGSKTEFHLPLKPQPLDVLPMNVPGAWVTLDTREPNHGSVITAPYKVGQIIKVRETWAVIDVPVDNWLLIAYKADYEKKRNQEQIVVTGLSDDEWNKYSCANFDSKLRSAATMPLWASRLSLMVLDVQVSKFDLWKFVVKVEVCHG